MSELSITALVGSGGDVLQCGYTSLREQARSLERLAASIDERFVKAVRLLLACKGQIIVAGQHDAAQRLASGLNDAGCAVRSLSPGTACRKTLMAARPEDLVVLLASEDLWSACIDSPASKLVIGCSSDQGGDADAALHLPVVVDAASCPSHLLPAVQELALLAQVDALASTVMTQRQRALGDAAQLMAE
ncbi:MAG: hypothetical protein HWE39_22280 [Oceanospirillaceae bacterium]|nr:hypothetical protein [Oceanospirillaceae bacterium]